MVYSSLYWVRGFTKKLDIMAISCKQSLKSWSKTDIGQEDKELNKQR